MNHNKKGSPNNQLSCEICEIDCMSHADYALHEFTKKHCDNLIRLAKNKPILKKQKTKGKVPEVEKEPVKVNTITHTGSFAKYGYFIPGEIYAAAKDPKEFNSDYDPYLQKFAENPFKETPSVARELQQQCTTVLPSTIGVPKKKKKKKSNIKICQICNVTLLTTPSYEAHMKSPEHILKLKVSGMGVSAHFVKASSDLHTTETKEEVKLNQELTPKPSNQNATSDSSSALHCDVCELVLNSSQQYLAHVTGKYHIDCCKKKTEEKELLENPLSDKLFCYTCNIMLNTVFQYNEHKHGKKHKIKCRALIRKGMSVPPEERVPGIGIPSTDPGQPVYPELYVKMILERQKKFVPSSGELSTGSVNKSFFPECSAKTDSCNQSIRLTDINENSGCNMASIKKHDDINFTTEAVENTSSQELLKNPNITFHTVNFVPAKTNENSAPESISEKSLMPTDAFGESKTAEIRNINKESKNNVTVLNVGESLYCSICNENFQWQFQFDTHLTLEDHLRKIVELKVSGKSDSEILNLIFSDRNSVKPNNLGRLICSICKVTADNKSEFEQHLSSVLHKYTEKDYKHKRTIEVKNMIQCDDSGMYYCKLCRIGLISLVEFSQHLFSAKHKSTQKRRKTSRVTALSQRQRLSQNLKRKYILLQSLKAAKNPGVRTKVCGVATDLTTGAQSKVPNLELLEPKIEPTKNVTIGVSEKSDSVETKNKLRKANIRNRRNLFTPGKKVQHHNLKQFDSSPMPPSLPSGSFFPSMNFSRFPNRPHHGWLPYPPNVRNALPPYNSHPYAFGSFYGRPPMNNPFYRAPSFQRTPWRNYRKF